MELKNLKLSIMLPAYNEEKIIESSLKKLANYIKRKNFSIDLIVVNDGSTDATGAIVKKCQKLFSNLTLINNEKNRNKGSSIKRGVLHANGDYILFTDADLATPIKEFDKFLYYIKEDYDIIIGSRRLPNSKIITYQPIHRKIAGKLFSLITQFFLLRNIKDTQCGFKCFKKEVAHKIFRKQTLDGFSFDLEILFIAKSRGFTIKEVPIVWNNNPLSKLGLIKDGSKMILDIFRIKLNNYFGVYKN